MRKLVRMSLHCFSLFLSSSLLSELNNQVCERTRFCWRLSLPGIYEEFNRTAMNTKSCYPEDWCGGTDLSIFRYARTDAVILLQIM